MKTRKDIHPESTVWYACAACHCDLIGNQPCPNCEGPEPVEADHSTGQDAVAGVCDTPVVVHPDSAFSPERYIFFCCRCLALASPLFFPRRWHRAPWMRLHVPDMRTGTPPPVNAFLRFFLPLSLFFLRRPEDEKKAALIADIQTGCPAVLEILDTAKPIHRRFLCSLDTSDAIRAELQRMTGPTNTLFAAHVFLDTSHVTELFASISACRAKYGGVPGCVYPVEDAVKFLRRDAVAALGYRLDLTRLLKHSLDRDRLREQLKGLRRTKDIQKCKESIAQVESDIIQLHNRDIESYQAPAKSAEKAAFRPLFPGVAVDDEEEGPEPDGKRHRTCEQDEYREPSVEY